MSDRAVPDATPADTAGALPRDVVRVLGWSRGHLLEPVGLRALARIAGVRPRIGNIHDRGLRTARAPGTLMNQKAAA